MFCFNYHRLNWQLGYWLNAL